jgi:preprotein translocase subunit YajC
MKVGTGSKYFVHIIIIVLLVVIIAMLLMQGQKKESFGIENFYASCSSPGVTGTAGGCNKNQICKESSKGSRNGTCASF